jgi:hypothetical protein
MSANHPRSILVFIDGVPNSRPARQAAIHSSFTGVILTSNFKRQSFSYKDQAEMMKPNQLRASRASSACSTFSDLPRVAMQLDGTPHVPERADGTAPQAPMGVARFTAEAL